MKILFSYPTAIKNEITLINEFMNSGDWDLFHLRKPNWKDKEIRNLFNQLNDEVKQKTVLHNSVKRSCHSFEEIENLNEKVDYCFLSPIFNSISKEDYQPQYTKEQLKKFLRKDRKIKVIALGGITATNYKEVLTLGFDGGAFLGSVWNDLICHAEHSEASKRYKNES